MPDIAPDADLVELAYDLTGFKSEDRRRVVKDGLAAIIAAAEARGARRGASEAMERAASVCEKRAETLPVYVRNEAMKCGAAIRFCVGVAIAPESCPNCHGSKRIDAFPCPCAGIKPLDAIRARAESPDPEPVAIPPACSLTNALNGSTMESGTKT
jgi:hypothetical protein